MSFLSESKPTSLTKSKTEERIIHIRTAHYENFIYVLLDVLPDKIMSKGWPKTILNER